MSILKRYNIHTSGEGTTPMLFAHGFGCDQNMWRFITPAFESDYKVITFDYIGAGKSDLSAYDREKYSSLNGYADDVLEICHALKLEDVIFVGHSVSSMIGVLAENAEPDRFRTLVMIGPSPRYINDVDYLGGFTDEDIHALLDFLDRNYLGWVRTMAPKIIGNPHRPGLVEEFADSFCRTDPEIVKQFARVTFLSDNRADLTKVRSNCLILQCAEDMIALPVVGKYVHEHVANSQLVILNANGHCPHLSAPQETIAAIKDFLSSSR